LIAGQIEAPNENSLIRGLLKEQYCILQVKEIKGRSVRAGGVDPGLAGRDLLVMSRMLATMLAAGLPIVRALGIMQQQSRSRKVKTLLKGIQNDIEGGYALHQALGKYPRSFSQLYVSMVRAGELGGVLEEVLLRLAEHLEREIRIRNKMITAGIYPGIILIFTILTVIFILIYVLPVFSGLYESAGAELPLLTQMLLAGSNFLCHNFFYLLGGAALLTLLLRRIGQTPEGRYYLDRCYLKLPLWGRINSRLLESRFTRTMGILISSGIPILTALQIVEAAAANAWVLRGLMKARENISEGQSIARPLKESGIFEPLLIQMIAVGEETGTLEKMLLRMSGYYEQELNRTVEQAAAALEPLLVVMAALVVGGVVTATLLPVFELLSGPGI